MISYRNFCDCIGDKDFYRYQGTHFEIFDKFEIKHGRMNLLQTKTRNSIKFHSSIRPIGTSKPLTNSHPKYLHNGVYRRGVVSPLTRILNISPHYLLKDLRYFALKQSNRLEHLEYYSEIYPEWNEESQGCYWREEVINIENTVLNTSFELLLLQPHEIYKLLIPNEAQKKPKHISNKIWKAHEFCIRSIIFEMCSLALSNSTKKKSLLEFWLEYENSFR